MFSIFTQITKDILFHETLHVHIDKNQIFKKFKYFFVKGACTAWGRNVLPNISFSESDTLWFYICRHIVHLT
jgi:hypothetical protein